MMRNKFFNFSLSLSSLLLLSVTTAFAESNVTTIDTLVVYNQGAIDVSNGDVETRINHLFTTTNKIYEDSGLNIELKAVKTQKFNLDETADSGQVLTDTRKNAEIHTLRDEAGADEVVIYRAYANDGMCGLAYVNRGNEALAYAHVTIDCPGYVTGHEVGHNMSLWHSAKQDPDAGYARGHGVQEQFTTVMAYTSAYNGAKIYKFSDPDLDCNGEPCGIEEGLDNEADAVKAILAQAPIISNFREHVVVDTNNSDNNNTDDNTDNNTSDLDAAKKAYDDQLLVVDNARTELNRLRTDIKTQRNAANTAFRAKIKEAFTTYRTERSTAYTELRTKYSELRSQYVTALKAYRAKTLSRSAFIATIRAIRAERRVTRTAYYAAVKPARTKLIEVIVAARAERRATIIAARDAYRAYRNDVYRVEITKLRELKKIYDDLLKANG